MRNEVVDSKSDAILQWLAQELSDAKDIVGYLDRGEQIQLLRILNGRTADLTRQTYIRAMQSTVVLELLMDFMKDASNAPAPKN